MLLLKTQPKNDIQTQSHCERHTEQKPLRSTGIPGGNSELHVCLLGVRVPGAALMPADIGLLGAKGLHSSWNVLSLPAKVSASLEQTKEDPRQPPAVLCKTCTAFSRSLVCKAHMTRTHPDKRWPRTRYHHFCCPAAAMLTCCLYDHTLRYPGVPCTE